MANQIKERKLAFDLSIGDKISVASLVCVIVKAELIHFYTDDSFMRVEAQIEGTTGRMERVTVFFPRSEVVRTIK